MTPRIMLIDSDTASDDAVAIIMAAKNPNINLVGITIVSGNVSAAQGVENALYTLELCNNPAPVFIGAKQPFIQKTIHAHWYHGNDGMGDKNYPKPQRQAEAEHAVDAIIRFAHQHAGELELVTLGPLTNLACALAKDPSIATKFKRVVLMAGAANTVGNVTPAAEYNVWCDPEAAQMVMLSGMKLEMVGWEVALNDAIISLDEIQAIYALNTELATFAMDCNIHALKSSVDWLGDAGLIQNDPVAMAIAIAPELSRQNGYYRVEIELNGKLTRGMTVVDQRSVVGSIAGFTEDWSVRAPNVLVHHTIDGAGWKQLLSSALI